MMTVTKRSKEWTATMLELASEFALLRKQVEAANEEAERAEKRAAALAEKWQDVGELLLAHMKGDEPVVFIGDAHFGNLGPAVVLTEEESHLEVTGRLPYISPVKLSRPEVIKNDPTDDGA